MDDRLRIREATEADLPALTVMTREFNDYLDSLGGSEANKDGAKVAAAAMERLRGFAFGPNPICTVLVAELDGETAGYLNYYVGVFMDDATPALHIADFYVGTKNRRRGLGGALMLEVRRIAKELGASRLFWTVWDKNEDAILFYRNLGAAPYDGAILMEWLVKS
jgi:GNAT superfamily N-acetyltransferase